MKRKLKVLLLQLPLPLFNHSACELFSTIPLASGYLKAMTHTMETPHRIDVEILDFVHNEFSGDAMLIDTVLSKKPDVVGFSLYVWNINRSLYIIKEIKSRLPGIVTVIGGPGVTAEYSYIANPYVDIAVYGEGERAFIQILSNLSCGYPPLKDIGNICFKESGNCITTSSGDIVDELNKIPSPYLLGCLDPSVYKRIWVETMRWCGYRCKYCLYPNRSKRKNPFYSTERIKKEIALGKQQGVSVIDLHDSAFNISPRFNEICQAIEEINGDNTLKFKAFLRPELITQDTVKKLLRCGVLNTEVGLQSTNPVALNNIGRHNDLKKFIRGVKLLKKAGINTLVDIMVGLPGDTLESIMKTVDFLVAHKFDYSAAFTILSVSPCTELWKERERLGLEIQKQPPFYVLSTPTLKFEEIKKAISFCTEQTNAKLKRSILNPNNNSWFPFLYTYSQGRYPGGRTGPKVADGRRILDCLPVTQIIWEVDCRTQTAGRIKTLANAVKNRIANVATLWFKFSRMSRNIEHIKLFLETVSASNPYAIWHIFLETEGMLPPTITEEIRGSVSYRINHWDYLNVFANADSAAEYCRQAAKVTPILSFPESLQRPYFAPTADDIWSIRIKKNKNQRAILNDLLALECKGYLIDFDGDAGTKCILDTLGFLRLKKEKRLIRFKNRALQVVWDREYDDTSVCTAGKIDLCLTYDRSLKESIIYFSEAEIKFDKIEWDVSCGKFGSQTEN
ncbi:MAG: radical SAM protein [Candidatus Omnitrophota bacterium]